ncbi:hypothetical protein R83H12_02240 [Fibrobacteria bacterium R8-3-H12]
MKSKKKNEITIHSSTAEYLTFIAASGDSPSSVEMRYQNENIWLTQKMMAELYGVTVAAINQHIKRIFDDGELTQDSTIKKYLIVQIEGNRQVSREIDHYNLQMIIAVGFKVNNDRAVQFRKWAGQKNTALCKTGCSKAILTGLLRLPKNPICRKDGNVQLLLS